MKPLLRKLLDYITLHIGTNYAVSNTSREILDKILKLKTYIQKELPKCQITISTPVKRHNHRKASLTISHLSKKFKDLSKSIVDNPNIVAFYLNGGGFHLNDKGLERLAINLKLTICKLLHGLEPMNDEHDKERLDESTSIFITYEFSTLDEVVKEEDAKSSLCNLKLRNLNSLIFGQININSIKNKLELLFSLVSNNIDVLLISETKVDNTFPVSQFCVPGYSVQYRLDSTGNGGDKTLREIRLFF